jgi:hypothetical protein
MTVSDLADLTSAFALVVLTPAECCAAAAGTAVSAPATTTAEAVSGRIKRRL